MAGYFKNGIFAGQKLIVSVMMIITGLMGLASVLAFIGFFLRLINESERKQIAQMSFAGIISLLFIPFLITFALFMLTKAIKRKSLHVLEKHSDTLTVIDDRLAAAQQARIAKRRERQDFLNKIQARPRIGVLKVTVLGGAGWEAKAKQKLLMTADEVNLYLGDTTKGEETAIPLAALSQVQIAGAGTIQSGGGFGGGGFGGEGFLIGAGIATVLNALTTRTTTETVIYLRFKNEELVLLNNEMNPEAMRIRLSAIYVSLKEPEAKDASDISVQLIKLSELKNQGLLSEEEFALAKRKLLTDRQ